ncbi:MAG: hypothetical protein MR594_09035 [Lachnospiraceae bacterium]|nr:hypothetical protein [Lachnospiraceae bacterium]
MKFIRVYTEIENDGTPVYADEFVENAKKTENILLVSKEYTELVQEELENVVKIPDDIIAVYDKNLMDKGSRHIIMKIYENSMLEDWLKEELDDIDDEIIGLFMRDEYCSVLSAAWEKNINTYVQNEKNQFNEFEDEKRYKLIIDSLEKRNEYLESIAKQNEATIESMKAAIESNNNYIHNLQIHATNLDNDLKKYKSFYEEYSDVIENFTSRIEYSEKKINSYVDLYRNLLDELDELKTENLELKQKVH